MSLVEEIISAVLDRPPLWNSKDYNHKNRRLVRQLWEEIKEKLNIEVGELRKKWKNLRDNYRKELKKLPVLPSGDAGSGYKSKWQYFDQLSFLRDEVIPANDDSYLDFTSTEDSSAQIGDEVSDEMETASYHDGCKEEYFDSSPQIIDVRSHACNSSQLSTNSTTTHIKVEDSYTQQSTNSTLTHHGGDSTCIRRSMNRHGFRGRFSTSRAAGPEFRSRKRKAANDIRAEYLGLQKKRITLLEKELSQIKKQTSQAENKSEDYYFLMSLLAQMEKFTGIQKFRVRERINQVIMEELRTSMYTENSTDNMYNTHEYHVPLSPATMNLKKET